MPINDQQLPRDILATTLERYSGTLAENLPKMSPLFKWVDKNGRAKEDGFAGRVYRQPLEYGLNTNAMWYYRAEMLRVDEVDTMAYADYYIRQFGGAVTLVGLDEIMNDGKQAKINYFASKVKNLDKSFRYMLARSAYYDGTEHDGKAFGGMRLAIPDDPTVGRVGGLDRAVEVDQDGRKWWQSQKIDMNNAADLPALSAGQAQIRPMTRAINRMSVKINDGPDKAELMTSDSEHYIAYLEEVQEKQMITDMTGAGFGFQNIKHMAMDLPIVNDQVMPVSKHSFVVNSEHVFLMKAKNRWMTKLPSARNPQQDVSVEVTVGAGNMTYSNLMRQGVIFS